MGKLLVANIVLLLIVASSAVNLEASHDYQHKHEHPGYWGTRLTEKYISLSSKHFKTNPDNTWHQVDNLAVDINLSCDRYVQISYGLSSEGVAGNSHLVVKVEVDGMRRNEFNSISGNTMYLQNGASNKIYLKAGEHTIKVLYRSPYVVQFDLKRDWPTGFLKVIY